MSPNKSKSAHSDKYVFLGKSAQGSFVFTRDGRRFNGWGVLTTPSIPGVPKQVLKVLRRTTVGAPDGAAPEVRVSCVCQKSGKARRFRGVLVAVSSDASTTAPASTALLGSPNSATEPPTPSTLQPVVREGPQQATTVSKRHQDAETALKAKLQLVALQRAAGLEPIVDLEVAEVVVGRKSSTIFARLKSKTFPTPIKQPGSTKNGWKLSVLEAYASGERWEGDHE